MAKNEKDKQTAHTTQHRKLKNKQHEPHQKLGVISGAETVYMHISIKRSSNHLAVL